MPSPVRAGLGYDIHRLIPGRKLILGGVEIPSELGLDGHSDADALTHALADAVLFTTTPAIFSADDRRRYDRVEASVRLARYGCDCYAYCMVAAGHADVVVEAGLQPYDIVALIPIIEGAGGKVTNWQGGSAAAGGQIAASGDRRLHERLLEKLAG